jgi:glycosyltransferase involved in cell wall biosynthesis
VRLPALGRRVRPWSDLAALVGIYRVLKAHRPDVVHTHTAKAGTLGRLAAALYNAAVPRRERALVVHTFHGHVFEGYFGRVGNLLVRTIERALARISDRIVTISERQRADIVERFRVARPEQVVVVPLGLELDRLLALGEDGPNLRGELGIGADAFVIGFVGRLVPIKAPEVLLEAFAQVAARISDTHLLVIGDGPLRESVEARAAASCGRIHVLGWRHDLERIYQAADVVALTSDNEGTPVALIEAMAAGRAVVATRVGGVPDLVADGETGLLVPARDPGAMADAIAGLAEDPGRRRRLGAAARDRVRRRFGAPRLVAEIAAVYRDGLEGLGRASN